MEEIEVGEYVRINKDHRIIALGIGKIVKISNETVYVKNNFELPISISKNEIKEHSKNIIDLIEVGDYVNGFEVDEFDYEEGTLLGIPCYTPDGLFNTLECYVPLEEIEIKEILTYEQYENNCYKVVE